MDREKVSDRSSPTKLTVQSRRRFVRHRADVALTATILDQDGYKSFEGRCSEIAEGGLGAIIPTQFTVGEIVSLQVALLSSSEPLKLRAVVRRRKGLFHGFEFLEFQPEQRAVILAFCQRQKQT